MAKNTNISLRNQMIYQVFPRQHSKEGNFLGVIKDLDRIKELGCDILYLLPIHPIGQKNKKGSLGCPYSIQNYREINKDLGTKEDFCELIQKTHEKGMKIIIDVVYNHTSRDSYLLENHPEWFYKNEKGEFANRVGDWWDVTDLDYTNKDLWVELADTLCYWAKMGVDGFRCDVASMVPLEFWVYARSELEKINPDIILLAESIHLGFVSHIRNMGFEAASDCELYEAFDMEYDYDIYPLYEKYVQTGEGLNDWLQALQDQEGRYPKNYVKSHCLENHDFRRMCEFVTDEVKIRNLNALIFFLKGITFIYQGQEACDPKLESLFDIDKVDFSTLNKYGVADLISKCSQLKKDPLFRDGVYHIHLNELEIAHISYESKAEKMVCIANLGNCQGKVKVDVKDGNYINLFDDTVVEVEEGMVSLVSNPMIFKALK